MNYQTRDDISIKTMLEKWAHVIEDEEGKSYYFLPYWFSQNDWEDEYEMHRLDHLPENLKKLIKKRRGE